MKEEVLIFGAGALSLGFLGPELSKDYQITFIDREYKSDFLAYLKRKNRYWLNISFPQLKAIEVKNVTGLNLDNPEQKALLIDKICRVPIIFTAVGSSHLKSVASILAKGIKERKSKDSLFILCSENGWNIEALMESHLKEDILNVPSWVRIGNPIMGRMCRCEEDVKEKGVFQPVANNFDWAIIAEPWYGIPLKKSITKDKNELFDGSAFQIKEDRKFTALKRMKFLLHNGTHAFLSYLGYLKGYSYFYQLAKEKELLRLAHKMMSDEIIKALLSSYPDVLDENEVNNYAINIFRRILCPVFKDSIKRGIRGSKLKPEERLISGAKFIVSSGYLPQIYSMIIAAAIKIDKNEGRLKGSLERILLDHCQLKGDKDKKIIELVKKN